MTKSEYVVKKTFVTALVGNPNCGKTALFNALTHGNQKVGNYPGVTVEKKEGKLASRFLAHFTLVDTPGLYSLNAKTLDEQVSRDVILGNIQGEKTPDVVVAVLDATQISQNLNLVLELLALNKPMVVALNRVDLARNRGIEINSERLSQKLGCEVIETIATKKHGLEELVQAVHRIQDAEKSKVTSSSPQTALSNSPSTQRERMDAIDTLLETVIIRPGSDDKVSERLDTLLLHPIFGSLIFFGITFLIFQAVFSFASVPADMIEVALAKIADFSKIIFAPGMIRDLLSEGIIPGIGSILVFLPQILILFFFILLLEDSGYMARAAFLMDHVMGKVGLNGRAFIPLISSYACAIPGIMATRTIEDPKDRLATILAAPLITCSARLPVYTLLVGAFVPARTLGFGVSLQGLVLFGLYVLGVVFALGTALLFKAYFGGNNTTPQIMQLPSYQWPQFKNLWIGMRDRAQMFLKRAGTVILSITVLLWFASTYPQAPMGATEPAISYSYAGIVGKAIEPFFRPIGFDWRICVALIPGFAAREVMVSALGTVYAVENAGEENLGKLAETLSSHWSLATALSLVAWYVFALQCLSTVAVIRRETHSWKWPVVIFVYLTVLAYFFSYVTYRSVLSYL